MKKNKRGFTLFELLVSISIIGILTAIASVSFSSAQKKARDARRMEDMASIAKAAETYYSVGSYIYPATLSVSDFTTSNGDVLLSAIPVDPKNTGDFTYSYTHPEGDNTTFCACALMENPINGNSSADDCDFVPGDYYCVKNQQ